ncbi:MAG: hypothetical protein QOI77_3611 [Blastocatellia bacterium]|jgi:hypothetical protein|nr:hypothetical protein [Blastocatellia bacterium]
MRNFAVRYLSFSVFLVLVILLVIATESGARPDSIPAHVSDCGAQEQDGWTALKTDDGLLFIWNRKDISFTLSIKGHDIKPMDSRENIFFAVDGLPFQIQSLPIGNFAPEARKNKLDDKAILFAHRDWESNFIADELLHKKLAVQSSSVTLANGSEGLIWQFDMPKEVGGEAKKQIYLTRVNKGYVILLNSIINDTFPEEVVRKFLVDTINTLKVSDAQIDVKKLQESLRKGNQ